MRDDILDLAALANTIAEIRLLAGLQPDSDERTARLARPAAPPRPVWTKPKPPAAPAPRRERYYQRVNRGLEGGNGPRPWR